MKRPQLTQNTHCRYWSRPTAGEQQWVLYWWWWERKWLRDAPYGKQAWYIALLIQRPKLLLQLAEWMTQVLYTTISLLQDKEFKFCHHNNGPASSASWHWLIQNELVPFQLLEHRWPQTTTETHYLMVQSQCRLKRKWAQTQNILLTARDGSSRSRVRAHQQIRGCSFWIKKDLAIKVQSIWHFSLAFVF